MRTIRPLQSGLRWCAGKLVGPPFPALVGPPIDESNCDLVWQCEDAQHRRQLYYMEREYRAAKMNEYDHPEKPGWRLERAIVEIVEAGYPSDAPAEHAEQSRKVVGLAGAGGLA